MFVAKWYTRASRVRIVIAKFDGRWKLPGGPYPIPELAALVGGILATLFLLPRLGQPVLTGAVGIVGTVIAVGVMRKMPYSPVKLSTRVHRVALLYTSPISVSTGDDPNAVATVSRVRPQVEVLDTIGNPSRAKTSRQPAHAAFLPAAETEQFTDLFGHRSSPASELFS